MEFFAYFCFIHQYFIIQGEYAGNIYHLIYVDFEIKKIVFFNQTQTLESKFIPFARRA